VRGNDAALRVRDRAIDEHGDVHRGVGVARPGALDAAVRIDVELRVRLDVHGQCEPGNDREVCRRRHRELAGPARLLDVLPGRARFAGWPDGARISLGSLRAGVSLLAAGGSTRGEECEQYNLRDPHPSLVAQTVAESPMRQTRLIVSLDATRVSA